MIAIELRFPSGRYHATPFEHHVNEGLVEWPPSPLRLVRALIATWHLKARGEIDDGCMRRLVDVLSDDVPQYALPHAAAGHTRHYMPVFKGPTTKVFDAFLHVADGEPLTVVWPTVELEEVERRAFDLLCARLGYLGRAESWVSATLLDAPPVVKMDAVPVDGAPKDLGEHEIVRLLAPAGAAAYQEWRTDAVRRRAAARLIEKQRAAESKGKPADKVRLSPKEVALAEASLPSDLLEALQADTGDLRKQGWSLPPGTRAVDYRRPRSKAAVPATLGARTSDPPTVARFCLASEVPPRLTDAFPVADRIRDALLSRSSAAPVFNGRDEEGRRDEGHRHAFILPEAEGRHGRITHVTVYASMGFDAQARDGLETLSRVWGRGGYDSQLVLLGVGHPVDFAGLDSSAGQCTLLATSTVWISRTPFIPTRHPKTYRDGRPKHDGQGCQIGSAEHDLRRLLLEGKFPEPTQIRPVSHTMLGGKATRWLDFRTTGRRGDGRRGSRFGFGYELTFAEPVSGPIALGYGAHFGLGVFAPA